jgi:hypothetical protein
MARDRDLSKAHELRILKKSPYSEKILIPLGCALSYDEQKAAKVEMPASIVSILEPLTADARSSVLTGDEPWFYFSCDYEGKWARLRARSMTKPRAFINIRKIMVLVIWGVDRPALVEIVLPNMLASAKYSCEFAIHCM